MEDLKTRHGKLTAIYNEPMSFKEVVPIIFLVGIPFSAIFALIVTVIH